MTTAAPDATPDWSAVAADVRCPLCDYNLRGLTDPRCPECGYGFAWAEVLAPPPTHPWLFECQPKRNLSSFARTQLGGYRPRRFWAALRPEVRIRPVRLAGYWVLSAALLVAGAVPPIVRAAYDVKQQNRRQVASMAAFWTGRPTAPGWTPAALAARYDPPVTSAAFWSGVARRSSQEPAVLAVAAFLCWPWATFAALQVFAASVRRARVRRGHVLRCVLYSCDFGMLAGAAIVLATGPGGDFQDETSFAMAVGGMAVYVAYRLGTAHQLYLRFHRPFLTALASQAIVFLLACKGALWATGY